MKVAVGSDHVHRQTHAAVSALSMRLANTVVVHYLLRLSLAEQAERLSCQVSTVHARLEQAHREIAQHLQGARREFYEL